MYPCIVICRYDLVTADKSCSFLILDTFTGCTTKTFEIRYRERSITKPLSVSFAVILNDCTECFTHRALWFYPMWHFKVPRNRDRQVNSSRTGLSNKFELKFILVENLKNQEQAFMFNCIFVSRLKVHQMVFKRPSKSSRRRIRKSCRSGNNSKDTIARVIL